MTPQGYHAPTNRGHRKNGGAESKNPKPGLHAPNSRGIALVETGKREENAFVSRRWNQKKGLAKGNAPFVDQTMYPVCWKLILLKLVSETRGGGRRGKGTILPRHALLSESARPPVRGGSPRRSPTGGFLSSERFEGFLNHVREKGEGGKVSPAYEALHGKK